MLQLLSWWTACLSRILSAPNELLHLSSGNLKNPPLLVHRSEKNWGSELMPCHSYLDFDGFGQER
jgi:hypothetical protein